MSEPVESSATLEVTTHLAQSMYLEYSLPVCKFTTEFILAAFCHKMGGSVQMHVTHAHTQL